MSDLQRFSCLIEVWGIDPRDLPDEFGATKFISRGDGELDAAASLLAATISDHQREAAVAERRPASTGRHAGATAALQCVYADTREVALTLAEEEVELTIDCMNFFSDLGPLYRQSPLLIARRGTPPHGELRLAIAEDGDCHTVREPGPPRNYSIKVLRDAKGVVRESVDRVEALLRNRARTEVEERLLHSVRWGGRATAASAKEEQLLFMMIALESVVKPTKMRGATKTVARRAASLQAYTEEERSVVQAELEQLYDRRSSVAHVGLLDVVKPEQHLKTSRMRKYAKGVVLSLLTDPRVRELTTFDELAHYLQNISIK